MMLIEDKESESQKRREISKPFGVGYLWPRIGVLGGSHPDGAKCTSTAGPEQRATQRPAKIGGIDCPGSIWVPDRGALQPMIRAEDRGDVAGLVGCHSRQPR